jgi:ABC-type glycerol-3-phosphate transport system substrate-binding protein
VSLGKLEQYRAALGNDVPDVFYPPMLPGSFQTGQMVDFGPNNGWALTKWAQDRDAGILYLRFLLSKDAQQILGDNGSIPSNTEIVLQGKDPVEDKLLAGFALEGNRTTYMAMPAAVLAIAERQTPAYVSGELSAQELMDQLEAAMAKLRPKYTR